MLRITGFLLAAILTGTIIWAFGAASFWESFGRIIADPWGVVSLVDLYVGFIVASILIFMIERGGVIAWAVIIPTFFLGNVVTALWLAWRAPQLLALLKRQPDAV
jgi:hypothetical protein